MMRRIAKLQTSLHALIAAPLLTAAWLAVVPAHAEEVPFISIVTGLAPDDLLNIRAKPSPMGKTEARVAAGASVRNLGCNDIDGHPWCKIVSDNPAVTGWAPARYLIPVNPATVPESDQPADAPTVANAGQTPDDTTPQAGQTPDAVSGAVPAAETAMPSPPAASAPAAPTAPPPDLKARLGEDAPADRGAPKSADAIGRTAMEDAYGLAFAAVEPSPFPPAPGVPCARHVGEPMMQCQISVAPTGGDSAVTVTWPDGGTRIISFHGGLPVGSDSPDEFRFTREGSLNMIRIGASERFEITDAVATGG